MKTFSVEIERISYASSTFEVEAENEDEAIEKALIEAGNYSFSEYNADYEVGDVEELQFEKLDDEE